MKATLLASACAVATLSVLAPTMALAPEQETATTEPRQQRATTLEEVVVTATRRTERVQDVPLSITTLSQEDLNERGIANYDGLATADSAPDALQQRYVKEFEKLPDWEQAMMVAVLCRPMASR